MHLKLVSCEVFRLEWEALVAELGLDVDIEYLPIGLHELPVRDMCARVQELVDRVSSPAVDAIALGYGICSGGLSGLTARETTLILPRAHDCISLLLGSRARHEEYMRRHPGACFRSSGWLDRGEDAKEIKQNSIRHRLGLDLEYRQLVEKYGEDNARYIAEQLGGEFGHCDRVLFIEMGVEPDGGYEERAREQAAERDLVFDKERGDLSFLRRLLSGQWDESEFLVVKPGQRVDATWGDGLVEAKESPS